MLGNDDAMKAAVRETMSAFQQHQHRENQRAAAGVESDLERYLRTGIARDC